MDVLDIPIEDCALYKLCLAVLEEHNAQLNHEYPERLAAYHSRVRGALGLRVQQVGNWHTVSFTIVTPAKEADGDS